MYGESLKGKRVLVTGAGTGIGREIALEFARAGAAVALHYYIEDEGAASAVSEIEGMGGGAKAFQADLRRIEACRSLGRAAIEYLGGLDVLVNNAGITLNVPFEEVTPVQFDTLYHVNVRAPFFLTQAVLETMVRQGAGVVINLASIHAFEGMPEHSIYAGTKGAVVAFTRELAIELAPLGIRVNAIAPGAVPVENHFKTDPNIDLEAMGKVIPAGFPGRPADIAKVATFLASDAARYIIGQTIVVDGGTTSWMPFSDGFRQRSTARLGVTYVPEGE